jgi:hypothetical protein
VTAGPPWELDCGALVEAPVSQASLLLYAGGTTMLLDVDRGEMVALPGIPRDGMQRPLALSPEGARLLLWCLEDRGRTILLVALDLRTGERLRLPAPPGGFDHLGAWSPDGRAIATLSDTTDDDAVAIDIVDLASRQRRRLWTGAGGAGDPSSSVAWSPGGRLIAATYYHDETDESATVIVDVDTATQVAHYEYRMLIGCPNGTWIDDEHVTLVDQTSQESPWPRYLTEACRGTGRRLAASSRASMAFVAGRWIARDHEGHVTHSGLDGDDDRPLLVITPQDLGISRFDVAPRALVLTS